MTDQELVQRLESTPADAVRQSDLIELKQRLAQSEVLQSALARVLHKNPELRPLLLKLEIDLTVYERAKVGAAQRTWIWPVAAGVGVVVLVALALMCWHGVPPSQPSASKPAPPPEKPSEENSVAPSKPEPTAKKPEEESKPETMLPSRVVAWPGDTFAPPVPFLTACFSDFKERSTLAALQPLLEAVPDQPAHHLSEKPIPTMPFVNYRGIARLKVRFDDEIALRLNAEPEDTPLQLHFWNDKEGITLNVANRAVESYVAAYETGRSGTAPRPERVGLLGTDGGRLSRLGNGTLEIRWNEGHLIVTRGQTILLRIPLAHPPQESYLDGSARIVGLSVYRSTPPAAPLLPPRPGSRPPAELPWITSGDTDAKFSRMAGGSVEFVGGSKSRDSTVHLEVSPTLPSAYVFCFQAPMARSGIYFSDAKGEGVKQLRFVQDASGMPLFRLALSTDAVWTTTVPRWQTLSAGPMQPILFAPHKFWVRLVPSVHSLRCWISPDGMQWSELAFPTSVPRPSYSRVGLFVHGGEKPATLRLLHMEVQPFETLRRLVDDATFESARIVVKKLIDEAPPIKVKGFQTLLDHFDAHQPKGVSRLDWLNACYLAWFAYAPARLLGNEAISAVMESVIDQPVGLDVKLRVLEEGTQLLNFASTLDVQKLVDLYGSLARHVQDNGVTRPHSEVIVPLRDRAHIPPSFHRTHQVPAGPLRTEILNLVYARRWEELVEICEREDYLATRNPIRLAAPSRTTDEALVDWALLIGRQQLEVRSEKAPPRGQPLVRWRHPIVYQHDKDAYNLQVDLASALRHKQWVQACRLIQSSTVEMLESWIESDSDPELSRALPQFLQEAVQNHPEVYQAMVQQFSDLAKLRLERAVASDDHDAIRAITLQFATTKGAADAHRWLGDRALADRRFEEAIMQYERAQEYGGEVDSQGTARLRLAAAMVGLDRGTPVREPVPFVGVSIPPSNFEQQVRQLRSAASASLADKAIAALNEPILPADSRFELKPWTAVSQDHRPPLGRTELPGHPDFFARQVGLLVDDQHLFVNGRSSTSVYELTNFKKLWEYKMKEPPGDHWPLTTLRPLRLGNRLLVRKVERDGPFLHALNTETGNKLWRHPLPVVCDPLFIEKRMYAFTMTQFNQGGGVLSLTIIDPASGQNLASWPLLEFSVNWLSLPVCEVAQARDRLVVSLGAATLCCHLKGGRYWLRRSPWIPPATTRFHCDPKWTDVFAQPPIVVGGLVYVTAPGSRAVECLELKTGQLLWRKAFSTLRRIHSIFGNRAFIELSDGLVALDAASGELLWRHRVDEVLHAFRSDGGKALAYLGVMPTTPPPGYQTVIVSVDARDGTELGRTPLGKPFKPPMFTAYGPITQMNDRWFTFTSPKGYHDVDRTIVELVRP